MKPAKMLIFIAGCMGLVSLTVTAFGACDKFGSTHMTIVNKTAQSLIEPYVFTKSYGHDPSMPAPIYSNQERIMDACAGGGPTSRSAAVVVYYQQSGTQIVYLHYYTKNSGASSVTGSCGVSYNNKDWTNCSYTNDGQDGYCTCTVQ
ncbi:MAG: hypothetical protein A3F17_07225 [Gammaproteobacteria bacterium RIFCSPHIGHO2_12_FULL_41_15]|nr:MAG: hypothetical protein A3F17_07225 [Gammaproteobacteria bacterium RIFCSPHIGHO2_12_FULL_41_15]